MVQRSSSSPGLATRSWAEVPKHYAPPSQKPALFRRLLGAVLVLAIASLILDRRIVLTIAVLFAVILLIEWLVPFKAVREVSSRISSVQRRIGGVIQAVVLSIVWAIVVLPLGFVRRGSMSEPGWQLTSHDSRPTLRQFIRPDSGNRRYQTAQFRPIVLIGWLAALVLTDLLLGTAVREISQAMEPETVDPRVFNSAYEDSEWAADFWTEVEAVSMASEYVPYVGWVRQDSNSDFVNVEDGVRATWQVDNLPSDPIEVWFLGGSTTWGYGQRDDFTIASHFAKQAAEVGVPIRVTNFGELSHRNWQENLHLQHRLLEGGEPDLVIFYDGFNEVRNYHRNDVPTPVHARIDQFAELVERRPQEVGPVAWWRQRSLTASVSRRVRSSVDQSEKTTYWTATVDPEVAVENMMGVYSEGVAVGQSIGDRHGFRVLHFWQPSMYTKDPNQADADAWDVTPPELVDFYDQVLNDARLQLPEDVIDLADALDGLDRPVMADHIHVNELGASVIANRLFADARPVLEEIVEEGGDR